MAHVNHGDQRNELDLLAVVGASTIGGSICVSKRVPLVKSVAHADLQPEGCQAFFLIQGQELGDVRKLIPSSCQRLVIYLGTNILVSDGSVFPYWGSNAIRRISRFSTQFRGSSASFSGDWAGCQVHLVFVFVTLILGIPPPCHGLLEYMLQPRTLENQYSKPFFLKIDPECPSSPPMFEHPICQALLPMDVRAVYYVPRPIGISSGAKESVAVFRKFIFVFSARGGASPGMSKIELPTFEVDLGYILHLTSDSK